MQERSKRSSFNQIRRCSHATGLQTISPALGRHGEEVLVTVPPASASVRFNQCLLPLVAALVRGDEATQAGGESRSCRPVQVPGFTPVLTRLRNWKVQTHGDDVTVRVTDSELKV